MSMEYLREINIVSVILRIVIAFVVGGVIGIERGRKNRPAGFRTYILVCVGSALVMMTNQYVFQEYGVTDPVRMGAQVVSGIGFLGAGTIMVTGRHQIKGITTAAGLWAAACCGLTIGIGFYEGALIGGVSIFVVMALLGKLDMNIHKHSDVIEVYIEYTKYPFSKFLKYARENQFDITDMQMNKNKFVKDIDMSVVLTVKSQIKRTHDEMMEILSNAPGVEYIETI